MNIDEEDIKIFEILNDSDEPLTANSTAKKMFETKDYYELKKKEQFVRNRINKMISYNLLKTVYKDKKYYYTLNEENCVFGVGKIIHEAAKGTYTVNVGLALLLKLNGKKIMYIEVK